MYHPSYQRKAFSILMLWPLALIGQSLSLDEAIQIALKQNPRVRQYQERVAQKQDADRAAWGHFLPSIRLQASYNHLNDPLRIDLDPIREAMMTLQAKNQTEFANVYGIVQGQPALTPAQRAGLYGQYYGQLDALLPPFEQTLKEQDYKSAALVGVQPLFMGGKLIAAKKYASAEKQAAVVESEQVRNDIFQQTVDQYMAAVVMQKVVQTRQEVLQGMRRHREDARRLFEEGLIARYHLLRAEVAVADAERNLDDDQGKLDLAYLALANTLGLPEGADVHASDTLCFKMQDDSLTALLLQADKQQPLLRLLDQKKKVVNQKYAVVRAEYLPEVAGFGKYEMYPEFLSALEPRWVVGVQLNWSLFNGGKRFYQLQEAKHLRNEVDYLTLHANRQVNLWVQKSWRDVHMARERYEKLAASLALAEENLRLNEKRFQSGLGTSLEVVDAQLSLERIQVERISSLYAYYRAKVDLYTAIGSPDRFLCLWKSE